MIFARGRTNGVRLWRVNSNPGDYLSPIFFKGVGAVVKVLRLGSQGSDEFGNGKVWLHSLEAINSPVARYSQEKLSMKSNHWIL